MVEKSFLEDLKRFYANEQSLSAEQNIVKKFVVFSNPNEMF